jgi:hypothetical protein
VHNANRTIKFLVLAVFPVPKHVMLPWLKSGSPLDRLNDTKCRIFRYIPNSTLMTVHNNSRSENNRKNRKRVITRKNRGQAFRPFENQHVQKPEKKNRNAIRDETKNKNWIVAYADVHKYRESRTLI